MDELLVHAESLQNMMIARATTPDPVSNQDYAKARAALVSAPRIADLLPRMVHTCRDPSQFWGFIKSRFSTYEERRQYIWSEFRPLLDRLEAVGYPSDANISDSLERFDSEHVHAAWSKAVDRRDADPEGAITMARSLLESVCKHVIERSEGVEYGRSDDLPALYRKASRALNLAPDQHVEEVFRKILGGCTSVVVGLGELRNRVSDSHGQGQRPVKPLPRHAELAVNLSGTMSSFLIATLEARQGGQ
ncbi:abortive infection family protein [Chromohalobacter sp. 296-RDG]|uniref:abortive infection family protein n=1 Tax=Chromohalobacter sp. 296-RDG TaxID=2994062 RepID=UPI00246896C5|nr:abortive infection family protein [Chromohalobacter sp. 296-RDG]